MSERDEQEGALEEIEHVRRDPVWLFAYLLRRLAANSKEEDGATLS